jgi:cytochrome c-type protein NapC
VSLLIVAVALVVIAGAGATAFAEHVAGRVFLLGAIVGVPIVVSVLAMRRGFVRSSETSFCLSCHEMEDYGRSLFVDNARALPALHYQKRLIARDSTCYSCHTDYAMFGDVKAKANGLRHVWAHYVSGVPDKIQLYQPYPNYNCLHCHDDARSYLEAAAHQPFLAALKTGERSCLTCHNVGHALADVSAGNFWVAAPR